MMGEMAFVHEINLQLDLGQPKTIDFMHSPSTTLSSSSSPIASKIYRRGRILYLFRHFRSHRCRARRMPQNSLVALPLAPGV